MQFSFYVGIDVSKNSLDFAVKDQQQFLFHISLENSEAGLKQFEAQCQNNQVRLTDSLLCCEQPASIARYCLPLLLNVVSHSGWNPLCVLNAQWGYSEARVAGTRR